MFRSQIYFDNFNTGLCAISREISPIIFYFILIFDILFTPTMFFYEKKSLKTNSPGKPSKSSKPIKPCRKLKYELVSTEKNKT